MQLPDLIRSLILHFEDAWETVLIIKTIFLGVTFTASCDLVVQCTEFQQVKKKIIREEVLSQQLTPLPRLFSTIFCSGMHFNQCEGEV